MMASQAGGFFAAGSGGMSFGNMPAPSASGGFAAYGGSGSYGAGMTSNAPISNNTFGAAGGVFQPADPALVERRRQEYMAARAGNPLYLQGGGGGMPPPVERLDPSALGLAPGQLSTGAVPSPTGPVRRSALSELMAERERKDKKEKRHKKKKNASVAVLVEEDMPEAPTTPGSAPTTPHKDALDINLNDISPLEQLQHRQHRQVTESPKPTTAAPAVAAAVASPSKPKEEKHKHKDKESRHKHRKDKKDKSKSSKSETTRTLYKDSGLIVTYDHRIVDPAKPLITTHLTFQNKGSSPVFSIEIDLNDVSLPIRWQRSSPGPQSLNLTIAAGSSATKELVWNVASCTQPLKIAGKLSFVQQKEADKAAVPVSAPVDLIVPCSAYIYQLPIDQANFVNLLRGPLAQSLSTTALNATVAQVVELLSKGLGMYIVEAPQNRGSLYCKTILGHDVAALVKEEGAPDSLALAVKASDDTLGQSLIREIASLCAKR